MIKQTAGRDQLGELAPKFAHYNDDILFGENWNDEAIDVKTRCIITVVALISSGIVDNSLKYHLENAKKNGVTKEEMVGIITHIAFYVGWPKGWAVFNLLKEIYKDDNLNERHGGIFGMGEENIGYAKYFIGKSYLKPLAKTENMFLANVTFEPSCRNNWHIHHATSGGGQILICVEGEGFYQEENQPVRRLHSGDVVVIPANVKHWHGATKNSWFSHISVEVPGENTSNEWLEPITDEEYERINL